MTGKRRNDRKKKKIRENPCKSMRKIINEKNLRHLRNLRDKLIFSEKNNPSGEEKDPREEKTRKPQKSFEI